MDKGSWSYDALATTFHMISNWIPRFNLPMHSIHVDHGVHTIFFGVMAAVHDDLQPPLPLLSLSFGYLAWTKGSVMPTPIFLSVAHNWNDAPGPVSNLYTSFTPFLSPWIANSSALFGEEWY